MQQRGKRKSKEFPTVSYGRDAPDFLLAMGDDIQLIDMSYIMVRLGGTMDQDMAPAAEKTTCEAESKISAMPEDIASTMQTDVIEVQKSSEELRQQMREARLKIFCK